MSVRDNLKSAEHWQRGFFILLFSLLYSIAEVVLWTIVVFQFGSTLITGHANERLRDFSSSLNRYIYDVLQYLTYRSDIRPFPFMDWPDEEYDLSDSEEETYSNEADEADEEEESSTRDER